MKTTTRAMAILLILALMALPVGALAQEQSEPDAFSLTVDNFQVVMAGSPAVNVDLALNLNAGLSPTGDRGLWVLDLSGADTNVLTLIAALENGKVKGYLRNALGGLPFILEAPVDALAGMAQMFLPMAQGVGQPGDPGQLSGLLQSAEVLSDAASDPAYGAELRGKMRAAFESSFSLTAAGEAEIELFSETRSAQAFSGETDFAGLWAALPEIFATDPALKALYDEAVAVIEESGAFGPGKSFADLPTRLEEQGNDIQIAITEYVAGEGQLRLEFVMTVLEKGAETGTIILTLDSDISRDRQATAMSVATDIRNAAEKNVWISLESSNTKTSEGEDGYFGLLVETKGESGGTVALQLETQRVDATADSVAVDRALLSMAFISTADQSSYAASILYDAENREENGKPMADGAVTAEILQNGTSLMQLSFDVLFQRTSLSEGALFTADDSFAVLDVTSMTGEQSQEFNEAINTLFTNALGLLFQAPGMSGFLGETVDGGGQ